MIRRRDREYRGLRTGYSEAQVDRGPKYDGRQDAVDNEIRAREYKSVRYREKRGRGVSSWFGEGKIRQSENLGWDEFRQWKVGRVWYKERARERSDD